METTLPLMQSGHANAEETGAKRRPGRPPKRNKREQTEKARKHYLAGAASVQRADDECCICMDALSDHGSALARLLVCATGPPWQFACTHVFCGRCLRAAVGRSHKCPMCRSQATAWYEVRSSGGAVHAAAHNISEAVDAAVSVAQESLRHARAEAEATGGAGEEAAAEEVWSAEGELRVLRRCAGALQARETRRSKAARKVRRHAEAVGAEDAAVAALQSTLEEAATARRVAEVLVPLGCTVAAARKAKPSALLCQGGLCDAELFDFARRGTPAIAEPEPWLRATLGRVLRESPAVAAAAQEVRERSCSRVRGTE